MYFSSIFFQAHNIEIIFPFFPFLCILITLSLRIDNSINPMSNMLKGQIFQPHKAINVSFTPLKRGFNFS